MPWRGGGRRGWPGVGLHVFVFVNGVEMGRLGGLVVEGCDEEIAGG